MEPPLSVKLYTFTTLNSLQEFQRKVKGKFGEFSERLKIFQQGEIGVLTVWACMGRG
jgi:hypothetical protein